MYQKLRVFVVLSALALSLAMGAAQLVAQDENRRNTGGATTTTRATDNDDNGFDLGWLGLAGLAGLAGLIPRDRPDRTRVTTNPAR